VKAKTVTDWKDAAQAVQAIVTNFALIAGGIWALWRFALQRMRRAKIEFSLGLNLLGVQRDRLLAEVPASVTNRRLVRHWLKDYSFDLLCLSDEDAVVASFLTPFQFFLCSTIRTMEYDPLSEVVNERLSVTPDFFIEEYPRFCRAAFNCRITSPFGG